MLPGQSNTLVDCYNQNFPIVISVTFSFTVFHDSKKEQSDVNNMGGWANPTSTGAPPTACCIPERDACQRWSFNSVI